MNQYKIDRDRNGNRIVRVTAPNGRGFSIQTCGNLPETHRHGVCNATQGEVTAYVRNYGTKRHKALLGL